MANIKLTKKQQQYLAVAIVLGGAACFAYFKFFWLPISKKISESKAALEDINGKIEKAKRQAARLPKLEQELVTLNQQALEAEKKLPKTKSVPDILVTLGQLGQRNRVLVQTFTPGASTSKQYFFELNYPVTIKGSFHNIGKFLAALALEERIFNVMNAVYSEPDSNGDMAVSFTLISYQYKG